MFDDKETNKEKIWKKGQMDLLINDMVDIIINDENYKRKLIFTNVKNQKNGNIYSKILEEMKKRSSLRKECVPFTIVQLLTKFKKLIGECKKAALPIKSATGIKRFQDNKGYGDWFNPLFNLVKTRDACQPEQAIEPSASGTITSTNTDDSSSASQEGSVKKLFVPVKRNKKSKKKTALEEATTLLKQAVEKDPIKDISEFMREEAEKSRQHELMILQMQSVQPQATQYQAFAQPVSFNLHPGPVNQSNYECNCSGINSTMFPREVPPSMFQELHSSENERSYHSL